MINKIGYSDKRTSFGSHFKIDGNGYLNKLYGITVNSDFAPDTIRGAVKLRNQTPNHTLEILSLSEGTPRCAAVIQNLSTGAVTRVETTDGMASLLPRIMENLSEMAKCNATFWDEFTSGARLFKILTGQKRPVDGVI